VRRRPRRGRPGTQLGRRAVNGVLT
jgi:hypothetical protein